MLTIEYDPSQPEDRGRYWVSLFDFGDELAARVPRPTRVNRIGYWCDRRHLRHMLRAVVKALGPDLPDAMIEALAGGSGEWTGGEAKAQEVLYRPFPVKICPPDYMDAGGPYVDGSRAVPSATGPTSVPADIRVVPGHPEHWGETLTFRTQGTCTAMGPATTVGYIALLSMMPDEIEARIYRPLREAAAKVDDRTH